MTIEVTQRHIDRGERGDGWMCPIAIAARKAGLRDVFVWGCKIQSSKGDAVTPKIARNFIKKFDHEKKVSPIKFDVCFN